MREKIVQQILKAAEEMNEQLEKKIPVEMGVDAPLFGPGAALDSLGLVSVVVAVEQSLADEFEVELSLASDRAFAQKNSPFRTIGSLADYAESLLRAGGIRD